MVCNTHNARRYVLDCAHMANFTGALHLQASLAFAFRGVLTTTITVVVPPISGAGSLHCTVLHIFRIGFKLVFHSRKE